MLAELDGKREAVYGVGGLLEKYRLALEEYLGAAGNTESATGELMIALEQLAKSINGNGAAPDPAVLKDAIDKLLLYKQKSEPSIASDAQRDTAEKLAALGEAMRDLTKGMAALTGAVEQITDILDKAEIDGLIDSAVTDAMESYIDKAEAYEKAVTAKEETAKTVEAAERLVAALGGSTTATASEKQKAQEALDAARQADDDAAAALNTADSQRDSAYTDYSGAIAAAQAALDQTRASAAAGISGIVPAAGPVGDANVSNGQEQGDATVRAGGSVTLVSGGAVTGENGSAMSVEAGGHGRGA